MSTSRKWLLVLLLAITLPAAVLGTFFLSRLLASAAIGNAPIISAWPWSGGSGFPSGCLAAGTGSCPYGGFFGGEPGGKTFTLAEARVAVERYIAPRGNSDLVVGEVMEFERNFYAIVKEKSTGIGAMEVLVDKWSGAVGPEPGPNMMWNTRYGMMGSGWGMMGGMMGRRWNDGPPTLSPEEAVSIAQRWLDRNLPGVQARSDDVDPFYGYYTLHVWKDGRIYGMLSVHGQTGQVWYHSWHGAFIAMEEEEEAQ